MPLYSFPFQYTVGTLVESVDPLTVDWLECDGSAVSRTTYSHLFTTVGTLYGIGDGATTFNLPDAPNYAIRGYP